MILRRLLLACTVALLSSCTSMPFRPAVVAKGSVTFQNSGNA